MSPLFISLAAGALIGLVYSLLKVPSPAPPAVALVGLLGMVTGSTLGGKLFNNEVSAWVPSQDQTQSIVVLQAVLPPSVAKQAG